MDYFLQLLQSYSKLKNRKLKLLEEDEGVNPPSKISREQHLAAIADAKKRVDAAYDEKNPNKRLGSRGNKAIVPIHPDYPEHGYLVRNPKGDSYSHSSDPEGKKISGGMTGAYYRFKNDEASPEKENILYNKIAKHVEIGRAHV